MDYPLVLLHLALFFLGMLQRICKAVVGMFLWLHGCWAAINVLERLVDLSSENSTKYSKTCVRRRLKS